jgi:adenosylcobinamide-GDP ribazoletransferase
MLSFFTRLPVMPVDYEEKTYIRGMKYVPFIGLFIGLLLYGVSFSGLFMNQSMVTLLLILAYILLTGALHLDGLADTCDAVFSGRSRERMLMIMRDSHIGVYGVLSIGLWLLFYAAILGLIPYSALIIMPIVGKAAPMLSARFGPYVREEGLGKVFADNCRGLTVVIAVLLPLLVSLIIAPYYMLAVVLAFLFVLFLTGWLKRMIGGITGDTMGFVCELSQILFLFVVYVTHLLISGI